MKPPTKMTTMITMMTTRPAPATPTANPEATRSSLAKEVKRIINKSLAQLQYRQEESDLSESDASEAESNQSYFQCAVVRNDVKSTTQPRLAPSTKGKGKHRSGVQFAQVARGFEPPIDKLFTPSQSKATTLDLREVLLLDSRSTVDLICNRELVDRTFRSKKSMRLSQRATVALW
jgi:hypothetical protein